MKCRKCDGKLMTYQISFDVLQIFSNQPEFMYCENNKCELFGIVVVAGKVDDEQKGTENE
jgi:hypothetical protein